MTDYAAIHARLDAKLAQAHQKKIAAREPQANTTCTHNWKLFRQTVIPTRPSDDRAPAFLGTGAFFIIKACIICKIKRYIDYQVER